MTALRRLHAGEDGVTLPELLIVMLLAAIIGGYLTSSLVQGMRTAGRAQERVYALTDLERVTQRVTRELRAADPLLSAGPDQVEATVYRDGQRLRFRFTLADGVLTQTRMTFPSVTATVPLSTVTTTMAEGLADTAQPTFTYLMDDHETWTAGVDPISAIRQIEMVFARSLRASTDPIEVETAVELRNTGFGG